MSEQASEAPRAVRDRLRGMRARVTGARDTARRLAGGQQARMARGMQAARERFWGWVTTSAITEQELTERVTEGLVEEARNNADPKRPTSLTPTREQLDRTRLRMRLARPAGVAVACMATLQTIGTVPSTLPALVAASAGYVWWAGRPVPTPEEEAAASAADEAEQAIAATLPPDASPEAAREAKEAAREAAARKAREAAEVKRYTSRAEEIAGAWPAAMAELYGVKLAADATDEERARARKRLPKITRHTATPWGLLAHVRMPSGLTYADLAKKRVAIESALDIRPDSLHISRGSNGSAGSARAATVRIVLEDPWRRPVPPELPEPGTVSAADPWPLGIYDDASPVTARQHGRHPVVVGETGAGKSAVLENYLGYYAGAHDQVRIGMDLAGGATLQAWEGVFVKVITSAEEAAEYLPRIVRGIEYREGLLARAKADAVRAGKPAPDELAPSPRLPEVKVIIDEFPELTDVSVPAADPDDDDVEALTYLESIGKRGRKVSVGLFPLTQNGTIPDTGSSELRAQLKPIIGLRVRGMDESQGIFGRGTYRRGWTPDRITTEGGFLLADLEHRDPRPAKGYYLYGQARTDRIRACAARQPVLDAGTARAMGLGVQLGADVEDLDVPADLLPPAPAAGPVEDDRDEAGAGLPPAVDQGEPEPPMDEQLVTALEAAGGGPLGWQALAEATGQSRPSVYRHMARLVKEGRALPGAAGGWQLPPAGNSTAAPTT